MLYGVFRQGNIRYVKEFLKFRAFTLVELLTVAVVLTIIAAFALPNFTTRTGSNYSTREHAYEKDAATNLRAIREAEELYVAQYGQYWPPDVNVWHTVNEINDALHLGIIENGLRYRCQKPTFDPTQYYCQAARVTPASPNPIWMLHTWQGIANIRCVTTASPPCPTCGACPRCNNGAAGCSFNF